MVNIYCKEEFIIMPITINYDPKNGDAFPDAMCRDLCNDACHVAEDVNINTSTFLLIDWFRVSLKNKIISLDDLIVTYQGEIIALNESGKFIDPLPKGFGDEHLRVLSILALRG